MICKHCGTQLPDDAMFCAECGQAVENVNVRRVAGYCPTCGSQVYEDNNMCENCGQILNVGNNGYIAPPPPPPPQYTAPQAYNTPKGSDSQTTLIVVLIVVIVALLGGIVSFLIFRDNFLPRKDDNPHTESVGTTAQPERTAKPTVVPTVMPAPTGVNTNPGITEYMYDTDKKLLTQRDLAELTQAETRLLLNEMYARHGYIFNLQEYKDYFSRKAWYTPRYTSQGDAEAQFNDIERQNKIILTDYEKSKGWR